MLRDTLIAYCAIAASLFLLLGYHVLMYANVLTGSGRSTQLSQNIRNSIRWVLKHREKNDAPSVTLGIQTFRNTILVAVFVGGNVFSQAFSFADNYQSSVGNSIEQARYIVLAVLLFGSFLCWVCVIRFVAHLGYIIGTLNYAPPIPVPSELGLVTSNSEETDAQKEAEVKPPQTPDEINKAKELAAAECEQENLQSVKECIRVMSLNMIFFSLGFRFLFMALPFAFLSMGGTGLIVATGVMLMFLYFYDYGYQWIMLHDIDVSGLARPRRSSKP